MGQSAKQGEACGGGIVTESWRGSVQGQDGEGGEEWGEMGGWRLRGLADGVEELRGEGGFG